MDSLNILQSVSVVVIMTEPFRAQMVAQVQESIAQIEQNLERLGLVSEAAEMSELERSRVEAEKARLAHRRQELEWRVKEAQSVKEGAELPFQEIQAVVPLKVGDSFLAHARTELVLKDGVVVTIRRSE